MIIQEKAKTVVSHRRLCIMQTSRAPKIALPRRKGPPRKKLTAGTGARRSKIKKEILETVEEDAKPAQPLQRIRQGEVVGTRVRFPNLKNLHPEAIDINREMKLSELLGQIGRIDDNQQTVGTIYDMRLGPLDEHRACQTCHEPLGSCLFHKGFIFLHEEAYFINPIALKYAYYVLRSVCNTCSRLLLRKEFLKSRNILDIQDTGLRLQEIAKLSKSASCYRGADAQREFQKQAQARGRTVAKPEACVRNPLFAEETKQMHGGIFYSNRRGEPMVQMDIERVRRILRNIPREDLDTMGFGPESTPLDYIVEVINVIPLSQRISRGWGGSISDPLEKAYNEIIKANNKIKTLSANRGRTATQTAESINEIRASAKSVRETYQKLLEGDASKNKGSKGRFASRGLDEMVKGKTGKEGPMRKLILGKQTGNMARTVLATGADIRMQNVGVPRRFRNENTVPETAYPLNIADLRRYILEGEALFVESYENGDWVKYRVKPSSVKRIAENLRCGDKVHRRIREDDSVIANRQPSIHKPSIQHHRIVFNDDPESGLGEEDITARLNLAQVHGQKGDYDGDELNLYFLQSYKARAEAAVLLDTTANLGDETNNFTSMFPTFEAPLGSTRLTMRPTVLPRRTWVFLATHIWPVPDIKDLKVRLEDAGVPFYSARGLVSAMLPRDFDYRGGDVVIEMGVMKSGVLTKDAVGPGDSITNRIRLKYGSKSALDFIDSMAMVSQLYAAIDPASIKPQDVELDAPSIRKEIRKQVYEAEVINKQDPYSRRTEIEQELEEARMIAFTDSIKAVASKEVMQYVPDTNGFKSIMISKAKGKPDNFCQMMGTTGQQFYYGKRIPMDYSSGTRVSPAFRPGDTRLESRGMCLNSLGSTPADSEGGVTGGLTPESFWNLAKSARKAMTDTSQTTPIPGKIRRQLATLMTNAVVAYDGSVRDNNGAIIQYYYNGDNYTPTHVYRAKFKGYQAAFFADARSETRRLNTMRKFKRRLRQKK